MPDPLTPAALAELRAAAHEAKMREQCGMVHSSRDGGILADGVLAMLEIAEIHQADIRIIAGMAVKASEARAERDQLRLRVQAASAAIASLLDDFCNCSIFVRPTDPIEKKCALCRAAALLAEPAAAKGG